MREIVGDSQNGQPSQPEEECKVREIIGYRVGDTHTGQIVKTYGAGKKVYARNMAERLNRKYGSHRYA